MDLEQWVVHLFAEIASAAEKGETYDLHLDTPAVEEIAEQYKRTRWIEIE